MTKIRPTSFAEAADRLLATDGLTAQDSDEEEEDEDEDEEDKDQDEDENDGYSE